MVSTGSKAKTESYIERDKNSVNQVLSRLTPIVAERAQGSFLFDVDGNKYLDMSTGIGVTNIGHCHPKVVEAIKEQASNLIHTSVTTYHKKYIETAEKLKEISPGRLDSVFLANSGAECVEGAVKLARYVTGRPGMINFLGSFHGRTHMCMALTTSKLYYKDMMEPLPPGIFTAPFPYVFRSNTPDDPEAVVDETFKQIDVLFNQFINPKQVACFIVEPILGEGGYIVPPDSFLPRLRKLADEHGILLIIDEVQSGFGRTGTMFACEQVDCEPDILTLAKGIADGMPLAAFVSRKELTDQWPAGRHGTTFGGNPISCAAALASMQVIEEENLPARAKKLGDHMIGKLKEIAKNNPHLADVRGRGLMIGLEFSDENGAPSKEWASKVAQRCLEHKMIVLTCGQAGQVVRLIPPLTMSDEEANQALEILEKAIKE